MVLKSECYTIGQNVTIAGIKNVSVRKDMQKMERKVTTVIFDLDGTLLNTLADLQAAVNYALTQYGYPVKSLEEVRMSVGNGVAKLMERVLPGGLENSDFESCLKAFREYYSAHIQDMTMPYPKIPELLSTLKGKGYRLGIVSNKFDAAVKQLKEDYFSETISVAIGESAGVRKKPAPDCVYKAMEELCCTKEQAVYVGDSDVDVMTAHNSGLRCIGVTWGFRDEQVLKQAGADWIVESPLDILSVLEKKLQRTDSSEDKM